MADRRTENDVPSSSMNERYLEALKHIDGWTTVSDWAIKFGELFPDLLEKANREAENHKRPSTGIREIAARISSYVSTGYWAGKIEVDESERPKRVRILSPEDASHYVEKEIEDDLEPLSRAQKIKSDEANLSTKEKYRLAEYEAIIDQLKSFFNLDFELEHAKALLNPKDPGRHHPDNVQILLKSHNRTKSSSNWERFSLDEQVEYIEAVVRVQKLVSKRMGVDLQDDVVKAMIDRLRLVF